MRRQRYLGKGQIAICQRSGIKCHASELVRDGRIPSLLVLPEWADAAHPQERPYIPQDDEGKPAFQPSPESTGPNTTSVLAANVLAGPPRVVLTWTAAEFAAGPRIETYDLYRDAGTGFELIDSLDVTYTAFGAITGPALISTDLAVIAGASYSYKVIATSTGPSLVSNTPTAVLPP